MLYTDKNMLYTVNIQTEQCNGPEEEDGNFVSSLRVNLLHAPESDILIQYMMVTKK